MNTSTTPTIDSIPSRPVTVGDQALLYHGWDPITLEERSPQRVRVVAVGDVLCRCEDVNTGATVWASTRLIRESRDANFANSGP